MCVHLHVETRGQPQLSFLRCYLTWFLRQSLSLTCRLAMKHNLMTCWCMDPACLNLPGSGITNMYHHSTTSMFLVYVFIFNVSYVGSNFMFASPVLCQLNNLPSLRLNIKKYIYTSLWRVWRFAFNISMMMTGGYDRKAISWLGTGLGQQATGHTASIQVFLSLIHPVPCRCLIFVIPNKSEVDPEDPR